jgi:predicted nucleic acid-binding protein
MIVVDTSIIGSLYLSAERTAQAEEALRRDPDWAAPVLWRSELRNVLAGYLRTGVLDPGVAGQIMEEATALMHGGEYEIVSSAVLRLAAGSRCSAYDCEFVALAQDLGVPLVTIDKHILGAFPETARALEDYVEGRAGSG